MCIRDRLFREDEIVCEAFDVPECKAMLVNGILERCPGKTIVSASGMAGYGNSNAIQTRKITKHFYLCGDEVSDSRAGLGLMAPRVMILSLIHILVCKMFRRKQQSDRGPLPQRQHKCH